MNVDELNVLGHMIRSEELTRMENHGNLRSIQR